MINKLVVLKIYKCAIVIFLVCYLSSAWTVCAQKLTFNYDASGNQMERRWICVNCPNFNDQAITQKIASENKIILKNEELNAGRVIEVYPNPVSEILNVNWQTPDKIFLKSIEVFGMSGNRVFRAIYQPGQVTAEVPFDKLPPGIYVLIGYYSDSKSQSIKIVKI